MQRKNLIGSLLMSAAVLVLLPASAFADSFTWKFASADVSGFGTLVATADGTPGEYVISSGIGSVTDSMYGTFAVSFLPCATPSSTCTLQNSDGAGANLQYDNLLYPDNSPGLELDGFGIVLTPGPPGSGATGLGVFDGPSQEFYAYTRNGYEDLTTPFQVTRAITPVSTTPEPASLALVGSGLAAIYCRHRRKK